MQIQSCNDSIATGLGSPEPNVETRLGKPREREQPAASRQGQENPVGRQSQQPRSAVRRPAERPLRQGFSWGMVAQEIGNLFTLIQSFIK